MAPSYLKPTTSTTKKKNELVTDTATYFFISDLEGCELVGRFNKQKQNTEMCSADFFTTLDKRLSDNKSDRVCFLGDYFDQGPYAIQSIIGIAYLKNKYKHRVHIILGNRDVNKFRLFYESRINFNNDVINSMSPEGMFGDINADNFTDINEGDRYLSNAMFTMSWMNKTMGINPYDNNHCGDISTTKNMCRHGLKMHPTLGHEDCLKLLKSSFTPSNFNSKTMLNNNLETMIQNPEMYFPIAIRILYTEGNIVEYIEDRDLLLSHAGGYSENMNAFGTKEEVDGLMEKTAVNSDSYYFTQMNNYRTKLTTAEANSSNTIKQAIRAHSEFYKAFIEEFKKETDNETKLNTTSIHRHLLLQAMGLKPNTKINADDQNGFASFIESCDHVPMKNYFKPNIDLLTKWPTYSAHGHINFGMDIPIIYKRNDSKYILACDTSVGMRPKGKPFNMNVLKFTTNGTKYGYMKYEKSAITDGETYNPQMIREGQNITIELLQGTDTKKSGGKRRRTQRGRSRTRRRTRRDRTRRRTRRRRSRR
jgi:hypothetical protein